MEMRPALEDQDLELASGSLCDVRSSVELHIAAADLLVVEVGRLPGSLAEGRTAAVLAGPEVADMLLVTVMGEAHTDAAAAMEQSSEELVK